MRRSGQRLPFKTKTGGSDDQDSHVPINVIVNLAIFVGLGIICAIWHKTASWTVATMWAGACLVSGALLGFLFGIPKTLQGKSVISANGSGNAGARQGKDDAPGQQVNTNLEEISDWLTKILVGLGLTELRKVPDLVGTFAKQLSAGLGGATETTFASAVIVYFSIVGFAGGYLLTRLFLQKAFFQADFWLFLKRKAGEVVEQSDASVEASVAINGAIRDLEKNEGREILEADIKSLEELRGPLPRSRALHIVLGRLYRWTGNLSQAIAVLTEFIDHKKQASENDRHLAAAFFNRACYEALQLNDANESQRESKKAKAIEDLKEAIALAPGEFKPQLGDLDLAPIRDDPNFPK
jgi:hypothetical protein